MNQIELQLRKLYWSSKVKLMRLQHSYKKFKFEKPSFMIMGEEKSGTTYLYNLLIKLEEIYPPIEKEINYFNRKSTKSFSWYLRNFPITGKKISFDASPSYLYSLQTHEKINQLFPDIKIVLLLREPIDRTISHYFHNKRWQPWLEKNDLYSALRLEEERLKNVRNSNTLKPEEKDALTHFYAYQDKSKYFFSIKHLNKYFSKEQILLVNSHYLYTRTGETLKSITNFLNIEMDKKFVEPNQSIKNKNKLRDDSKISKQVYDYLEDQFEESNYKLKEQYNFVFNGK